MKSIFHINKSTLSRKVAGIGQSMFALSDPKLLSTLLKEAWRLAMLSLGKVKVHSRINLFHNFMQHAVRLNRHHGASFVLKWMKSNSVAIQRFVAGVPFKSLRELEPDLPLPRLVNGLPGIIPRGDRTLIRAGNKNIIRFWLTLFGVYRVLDGPLKPKLSTITDPYTGEQEILKEFKWFLFMRLWSILPGKPDDIRTSASYIVNSQSAGPNFYNAMGSYSTDLCWWAQSFEDYTIFQRYCKVSKSNVLFRKFDSSITLLFNLLEAGARIPIKGSFSFNSSIDEQGTTRLPSGKGKYGYVSPMSLDTPLRGGQLSFKEEAAGKLRVFAIVDIWTQSVLAPLHQSIFRLLRKLPNDGTFDQDTAFSRAMTKSVEAGCAFSVDLTSATDRLPISIQSEILNVLTGDSDFGSAWSALLTNRSYTIPKTPKTESYGLEAGKELKYSVGQPMGALSSWAMLALTHHLIVQFAVYRLRGKSTWFSGYEVLGDDIVIFDKDVYLEYLRIMSALGVPCNPAKSIPSEFTPSCEFAKRTSIGLTDVSGLSWKEFLQGNNLPGKINLALRLGSRSLVHKESLLKAILVRHSKYVSRPVQTGAGHALIGILGSLIGKSDWLTLKSVICLLVDPIHLDDGENYEPSKVTIPFNQAMQVIINLMNRKIFSPDEIISHYDERLDFARGEILPFAAQTAYLKALGLVKNTVQAYDDKVTFLASVIIDCSKVESRVLKAQIRSVAEDILLKDKDPQDFLDDFEARIRKETRYGEPSIEWSLAMFKEATEFSMRFEYIFKSQQGEIPTDNALALIASRAGSKVPNYWFALEDFKGYTELGCFEKDWLRAAKSTVANPVSSVNSSNAEIGG